MIIGYARTSTADQVAGFEAQVRELQAAGCEKIFKEQVSSVGERNQLSQALEFVRDGDVFVVTKIDRLARSTKHLLVLVTTLKAKKVALKILDLGIDTSTPTGELLLTILGAIAQFEREMMLERQREGIAKAKATGKFKGRAPTSMEKKKEILRLADSGKMTKEEIAEAVGVGVATVYRVIAESRKSKQTTPATAE